MSGALVANATSVAAPGGVAVDASGNTYIAAAHRVWLLDATTGLMTIVAGNGAGGFSGDGGAGTSASLNGPTGVAVDGGGSVLIADTLSHRIRRVAASTGVISTVAGSGAAGFSGDGGPASSARLWNPRGVAVDGSGNVLVADTFNNRIRRVAVSTGVITTVAGSGAGGFSGDGGPATSASFNGPAAVAVDADGSLYIADSSNTRIRRVAAGSWIVSTVAGSGVWGFSGDGGPATSAALNGPTGVAVDSVGNLLVSDRANHRIWRVALGTGVISTLAGNGMPVFSGDGGPGTSARLNDPSGVAVDGGGNVLVSDAGNNRVRRLAAGTGAVTSVAGNGAQSFSGDGGPGTSASVSSPCGLAADGAGGVFIADVNNHRIRLLVVGTGIVATVAGNGVAGFSGNGGPATSASLRNPYGVAVDGSGALLIADKDNHRIRRVAAGVISTLAGNGVAGFGGDGAPATSASLYYPSGVAVDGSGNVLIADSSNSRIRRVAVGTGIVTTVAGSAAQGFSGDGGPATSASLNTPTGVAVDETGALLIADSSNNRIRRVVASTGVISTLAGNGAAGFSGSGGPATSASLWSPVGVAVDPHLNVLIADSNNNRIRRVAAGTGIITTVAGSAVQGFIGDGGPATSASLHTPIGVLVDGSGNVLVADAGNNRIRRLVFFSLTSSPTLSSTATPSSTQSGSTTGTASSSATASSSPTGSRTGKPSSSATASRSGTGSQSGTPSSSVTGTRSGTGSQTGTPSSSATGTRSSTSSQTGASSSATASQTGTTSASGTSSGTGSLSASRTATRSNTGTPSASRTSSRTGTASASGTSMRTPSRSASPTRSPSGSPTDTPASTVTATRTRTASGTPPSTLSRTRSPPPTATGTSTKSNSPTRSPPPTRLRNPACRRGQEQYCHTDSPTATRNPYSSATKTRTRKPKRL